MSTTPLPLVPTVQKKPEEEIGLIQGITPDSRNEWHFALALDKLELTYIYQYLLGGYGLRGSQKIDFVVFLATGMVACYIQGEYWHSTKTETEDRLKHAAAEHRFGRQNVFDFSEEETSSVEAALAAIRGKLTI